MTSRLPEDASHEFDVAKEKHAPMGTWERPDVGNGQKVKRGRSGRTEFYVALFFQVFCSFYVTDSTSHQSGTSGAISSSSRKSVNNKFKQQKSVYNKVKQRKVGNNKHQTAHQVHQTAQQVHKRHDTKQAWTTSPSSTASAQSCTDTHSDVDNESKQHIKRSEWNRPQTNPGQRVQAAHREFKGNSGHCSQYTIGQVVSALVSFSQW
uniref:Uncharacterized protein n=1 Tax=Globodera rostochiensis TaxID=31243 RepID=A0A914IEK0_GLORO